MDGVFLRSRSSSATVSSFCKSLIAQGRRSESSNSKNVPGYAVGSARFSPQEEGGHFKPSWPKNPWRLVNNLQANSKERGLGDITAIQRMVPDSEKVLHFFSLVELTASKIPIICILQVQILLCLQEKKVVKIQKLVYISCQIFSFYALVKLFTKLYVGGNSYVTQFFSNTGHLVT